MEIPLNVSTSIREVKNASGFVEWEGYALEAEIDRSISTSAVIFRKEMVTCYAIRDGQQVITIT